MILRSTGQDHDPPARVVRLERSEAIDQDTTATRWHVVRRFAGLAVLVVLVARLGAGPFVDGVRATTPVALALALATTGVTSLCCAWRWRTVAAAFGARLTPGASVAAVYRAQFLNATVPGGVVGDVDRAVGHGRDLGRLGPAVRAVVWERTLGQVVQVALTVCVVLAVPSDLRPQALVAVAVGAGALVVVVPMLARSRRISSDLRAILATPRSWRILTGTSTLAVLGHLLVFLVAVRVAGVDVPVQQVAVLGGVVLLGSAVPLSLAGWGPREGVAAWAFATAGLGASTGVTVAVAYGILATVATLPGAIVLLTTRPHAPSRNTVEAHQEVVHA